MESFGEAVKTALTEHAEIELPIICGAMYPCSNPELVAAASQAGGIGIIQPLSLVFVHRHEFRAGLKLIKSLTSKPVGMNIITEKSSKKYQDRMKQWLDISLEEGVRFFVTSLGDPKWVVQRVEAVGGVVYHDVTERKWAEKALASGARGLICVNNRAGGHAGARAMRELFEELAPLGVPLVGAGGISTPQDFVEALDAGYAGVQMGTRFIATTECNAHEDYKRAIVRAQESDIVLTEKISGVPVAVIRTPYIDKVGTKAGWLARFFLKHPRLKHYMRMIYSLISLWKLKRASLEGSGYSDYWQAGKSVRGIEAIEPVATLMQGYADALAARK
jgi:nitronate monooxygenase